MKSVAIAAGLACLVTFTSEAMAQRVRYDGVLTLTSAQNCQFTSAGQRFTSVYHPSNLGDNPDFTSLSAIAQFQASSYRVNESRFTAAFKPAIAVEVGTSPSAFVARIRATSTPANPSPSTQFVSLTGQIETFSEDPGKNGKKCVVGFRASYVKRV